MKVIEESEKVGSNLNIQKTEILASGPIISLQINGETMEIVRDFIFIFFIFYFLAPKSLRMVTAAMTLEDSCTLEENQ